MTTTTYQGYANYATWAVALWMDNDEELSKELHKLAHRDPRRMIQRVDDLKELVNDILPDLGGTLAGDLLGWAVDQVDWREILESHDEE